MLSNLGHVLMGVTDHVMVGHINSTSLAAAGFATVVFNVLLLFGIGVSYAITPLVAEADGRGDAKQVSTVVRHGLLINLLNSFLLVVIVSFGKNLLYEMGQPAEVVALSIPFLEIVTWSLIPVMIFQTFKQFAEGLSLTRIALYVTIGANVVNLFLNYVLVYGKLGFPELGLIGSGWSTFLSRVFMAVAIGGYIFINRRFSIYQGLFTFGNYSRTLIKKMLALGVPSGFSFIFEVAAFDCSLVMMGWMGTSTLAAHQIAINLATISYMMTAGLGAAATIRIGYFLGKKDAKEMRTAAWSLLHMALAFMTLWAIIFLVGRNWLPGLYVEDANVISIASTLLIVAGFFQLADGMQVVCAGALRGLQDVKVPSVLIFVSYWVIALPLGYYLAFVVEAGATAIWIGLLIGLTLTATAMLLRLQRMLRRHVFEPQEVSG